MDVLFNPFSIARRIKRPLILDGAMGSLLQQHGVPRDEYLWMSLANITHPDTVIELHKEYIDAGADIITTNTFRTNPVAIGEYSSKENRYYVEHNNFVEKSVDLVRKAAKGTPVLIAGSNPPAEDCYQKETKLTKEDYYLNHEVHIKELFLNHCNFILNETQSHYDEIEAISSICSRENIPFVVSIFFDDDLRLLSGEPVDAAIQNILKYEPLAIGFNCIRPETFLEFISTQKLNFNWGVYMNCGIGEYTDNIITPGISPDGYKEIVKLVLKYNPSFIGGCCGTTPDHIKKIKEIFDERIIH
jgi:methionine synthase I (cobalamin-dependent)